MPAAKVQLQVEAEVLAAAAAYASASNDPRMSIGSAATKPRTVGVRPSTPSPPAGGA